MSFPDYEEIKYYQQRYGLTRMAAVELAVREQAQKENALAALIKREEEINLKEN